jgi:hypothetical protein
MHEAENRTIKEVHPAMLEADRRARLRGLTPDEIDREFDDDDSEYWADFHDALRDIRAKRRRQ